MSSPAARTLVNAGRGMIYPLRRVILLFARHWPVLLIWYLIASLAHRGAIWLAAWVGVRHPLVGLMVLPAAVLVSLATYVVMFLLLRPSLRYHGRAVADGALADDSDSRSDQQFLDAVVTSLLPFLTFYFVYKFMRNDAIDYASKALDLANATVFSTHRLNGNVAATLTGTAAALTAIAAYVARLVIKRIPLSDGSHWRWLHTTVLGYLECLWIFFTIYGIANAATPVAWLSSRSVVVGLRHRWQDLVTALLGQHNPIRHGYDVTVSAIHLVTSDLWNAAVLPMMWLTVVAVIYGRQLPTPEDLTPASDSQVGARIARAGERADKVPAPLRYVAIAISSDWRARWMPVLNAFRLVTRGGLLPFLGFLLSYALLDAACGWFWIGLRESLGAHSVGWWQVVYSPVYDGVDAIRTMLRVCLLAAVYDRTVGALAGYLGGPDPAPAVDRPADDDLPATAEPATSEV